MKIQLLPLALLLLPIIPLPVYPGVGPAPQCLKYEYQITAVKQRLRQRYTITQGERLKQKLANLKTAHADCEKNAQLKAKRKKNKVRQKKLKSQQQIIAELIAQDNPEIGWTSSSPSKERLKQWQLLQQQEVEKFEQLKKHYQGIIIQSTNATDSKADPP